jgi:hypothetical protein
MNFLLFLPWAYTFGGYLNLAHALVVEKGDCQTLPLGQRLQRRVYAGAKLALGEISHLCRRRALLRHLLYHLDVATGAHAVDAQVGQRAIVHAILFALCFYFGFIRKPKEKK